MFLYYVPCRYELHAIVDEVYMLTIFQDKVTFESVLGMDRYCIILNLLYLKALGEMSSCEPYLRDVFVFQFARSAENTRAMGLQQGTSLMIK